MDPGVAPATAVPAATPLTAPAVPSCLLIACGALAHEIVALRTLNGWSHIAVQCLPADLHNTPQKIPEAVRQKIHANRGKFAHMFVAYADCGTGGLLDAVLAQEGVERMAGAHCWEFYAGSAAFAGMMEAELGTFFLSDFLLKHFDRLVLRAFGIDKNPQLLGMFFGNYKKLTYLAQLPSDEKIAAARAAAAALGLAFEYRNVGYGELATQLQGFANGQARSIPIYPATANTPETSALWQN